MKKDFYEAVNMSPEELEDYLQTETSQQVGWHNEGEDEAVGHQSGRHIVAILRKSAEDLDEEDLQHMRKVVSYVHRHLAQRHRLTHEVESSKWRHSLMDWGHDPLKGEE